MGSIPMLAIVGINWHFFGLSGMNWNRYGRLEEDRARQLEDTRKTLELIKGRGLDFSEEEKLDPSLVEFLQMIYHGA